MIESNLPTAPSGHHYEVETISPMVSKVWLCRNEMSQILQKDVRTIYCFIKGKRTFKVHKPKNAKECYVKSLCSLEDLSSQSPYSLFVPKVTQLFD